MAFPALRATGCPPLCLMDLGGVDRQTLRRHQRSPLIGHPVNTPGSTMDHSQPLAPLGRGAAALRQRLKDSSPFSPRTRAGNQNSNDVPPLVVCPLVLRRWY